MGKQRRIRDLLRVRTGVVESAVVFESVPRFAVISAHNRQEMLRDTIHSIAHQCDRVIVVDNASDPPITCDRAWHKNGIVIIRDAEQPPNLSRLWNRGIELAKSAAMHQRATQWDVAVFGDDVIIPHDWWDRVSGHMRALGCVAGATHGINPISEHRVLKARSNDIYMRMPGWAWMLKGESDITLDESFRWWWGDTDLDFRCREMGGVVIAPGPIAVNREPNRWTVEKPELTRQAGQDRMNFIRKWGDVPW